MSTVPPIFAIGEKYTLIIYTSCIDNMKQKIGFRMIAHWTTGASLVAQRLKRLQCGYLGSIPGLGGFDPWVGKILWGKE